MNSGAIEVPGVSNAKREIMLTEGGAAHLVTGDQEAEGMKLRKWLMITRRTVANNDADLTFAFVVTAQIPADAPGASTPDDIYSKVARHRQSCEDRSSRAEILDKMPFTLNERANFNGLRSILPGRALMLTENADGAEPPSDSPGDDGLDRHRRAPPKATSGRNSRRTFCATFRAFSNLRMISAERCASAASPATRSS